MIALIMAGGVGSRFWPLSRKSNPKQFLNIMSEQSMIQMTVNRLNKKIAPENIYIVTAATQVELIKQHLPELPLENIIIEPFGMNTAPCVGLSAKYLATKYAKNEMMIVVPADHLIALEDAFLKSLHEGETAAKDGSLVTFGIKPNYPATGYGYIEAGEKLNDQQFNVNQFKEKPDIETANNFLAAGNFFWNSGMFMWKIQTILEAFENYLPKVSILLDDIAEKWQELGLTTDISEFYEKMPRIPIDIGIMEQAEKRIVIPVDYGWSDVGSWKALYDVSIKDDKGNSINCETELIDSTNNLIKSQRLVSMIGVNNLIVIDSDDALLIVDRDRSEDVKKIVDRLSEKSKDQYL